MKSKVDVGQYSLGKIRNLTESTYVLRFSRNGMLFRPGQHLVVGKADSRDLREYSIYSGIEEDHLEILIKEVKDGVVSRQLKHLRDGELLTVAGPYGFFLTNAQEREMEKLLFIATGTGVAPFHSFTRSHPNKDYQVIHGVKTAGEAYDREDYDPDRYTLCTSRDNSGDFEGRITDYLLETTLDKESLVYLCGNSNMIFDAMDILHAKGFSQKQIFTEVYF